MGPMKSLIRKRSIIVAGRKTSISLEDEFWDCLREMAEERGDPISRLITSIDADRQSSNLSSGIRLFILRYYREQRDQQSDMVVPLELDPSNLIEA